LKTARYHDIITKKSQKKGQMKIKLKERRKFNYVIVLGLIFIFALATIIVVRYL